MKEHGGATAWGLPGITADLQTSKIGSPWRKWVAWRVDSTALWSPLIPIPALSRIHFQIYRNFKTGTGNPGWVLFKLANLQGLLPLVCVGGLNIWGN